MEVIALRVRKERLLHFEKCLPIACLLFIISIFVLRILMTHTHAHHTHTHTHTLCIDCCRLDLVLLHDVFSLVSWVHLLLLIQEFLLPSHPLVVLLHVSLII